MGTITVKSNGTAIWFSTEQPSADFSVLKAQESAPLITPDGQMETVQAYVLNTNPSSMRFHLPYCPSCADMNPKNRQDYTGTREELIGMGYTPCGYCKP